MTHDPSEVPIAADELEAGRAFLDEGAFDDALLCAARALSVAPGDGGVLSFADEAIRRHPEPLVPLTLSEGVPFGIVAARARALAARRQYLSAVDLALQVATFRPRLAYVPWAVPWLRSASADLAPADADRLVARALGFVQRLLSEQSTSAEVAENADAACMLLALEDRCSKRPAQILGIGST